MHRFAAVVSGLLLLLAFPLGAQEFGKTEIMEVARGLRFTDGPAWSPVGYLLFADVPNNRLLRYELRGEVRVFRENANGASGNAFDKRGRLITAEGASRRLTQTTDRDPEPLVKAYQGKAFNAPNDVELRRNGDIYFTDPAFGSAKRTQELDFHGVFRLTPKGELSLLAQADTRLHGIALSPDEDTLYVSDADRRVIVAMEVNNRGEVKNQRDFAKVEKGIPAGMCVDTKGNLYVAAERLLVFDKTGKALGEFTIPDTPSNCVFGDADGKGLYVTARGGVYRLESAVPGILPR